MEDRTRRIPARNHSIVTREERRGCAMLFDPDTGCAYGLNPVALLIWKLLDGKHSAESIQAALRKKVNGLPFDAVAHIERFVDSLVAEGLAGYVCKD